MKQITVLSGKGGVGKSSIAASLACALAKKKNIIAVDCDVDASNLALVLGINRFANPESLSTMQKPRFDLKRCTSCRKCMDSCYFSAIRWKDNKPLLKRFSCEGCGVCELVCPEKAVTLTDVENATIGSAETKYGFPVYSAQLMIGSSGSGRIVTAVKQQALKQSADIMLTDSAAGISCPVIASVVGSDYAIIVTEPSPSAISDMKRAVSIVKHFNIPYSVLINKHDLNPGQTKLIEKTENIIAKLPYDKRFAEALVHLIPIIYYDKKYEAAFSQIAEKMLSLLYTS